MTGNGQDATSKRSFSDHGTRVSSRGARAGFSVHLTMMIILYPSIVSSPGTIPAISSWPTEASMNTAYSTKGMLGGMNAPNVPEAATMPVARPGL